MTSGGKMNHGRIFKIATILIAFLSFTAHAKDFSAVPGEYVVKLKSATHIMSVNALGRALGGTVKREVSKDLGLILVERSVLENSESAVHSLSQNALVEYAEPNFIYRVVGGSSSLPTDPQFNQLWGMVNTGQAITGESGTYSGTAGIDIDAAKAWQIETGSNNVVVAVIDTGVNYRIPDLAPNIWVNQAEKNGRPGVDDDGNGYVDDIYGYDFAKKTGDPMDVYGHGTHCSGTIGARANDGVGIVGVAWNVKIMPIRFLGDDGSGSLADAVASIEYAIKNKANIMSNSWGGGSYSQALFDVITKAKNAGILFVAAAGNESNDNDAAAAYPASYQIDNIVSVAAIDAKGRLADFSNFGKTTVHVGAPGVDILSYTMKGLESWSGTSMATPHVSGIAALLLSQDGSQGYATLKSRILSSARPLGSLRNRTTTGGMANAYYALTNKKAPADANDPFNWQKSPKSISSPHPYTDTFTQEWTVKVTGASQISVYFTKFQTEANYDKVEFFDKNGKSYGTISGQLGDVFGPTVDGDTVTFKFTADRSNTDYGFDVGGIAYR